MLGIATHTNAINLQGQLQRLVVATITELGCKHVICEGDALNVILPLHYLVSTPQWAIQYIINNPELFFFFFFWVM